MNLQTKIPLSKQSNNLIDYESNVLLLGSCFVENIGEKLEYFKFQNTINPFGILFHPLAIENLITRAINKEYYSEEDIFQLNEQWHCFDAHSNLSANSKDELLSGLNNAIDLTHKQIQESTHLVITLGTSWLYRFIETDRVVANCHKVPQKKFLKELLAVEQIVNALNAIVVLVKQVNPKISVLFTVSPVRHIKDGIVENSRSKAHLISAIHEVVEPRNQVYYFPSYEIMMDELRDYRFYAEDMIHPSNLAVNYICEAFKSVWIDDEAFKVMEQVDSVQKGLLHKPFNPDSEQHQKFLKSLEEKKEQLQRQHSNITF